MRRRELLGGAVVAVLGSSAGCTGGSGGRRADEPRPPEEPETSGAAETGSYRIESYDYNAGETGPLVVTATVENTGAGTPDATLRLTVEVEGSTERRAAALDVPPGESATYQLTFDASVDEFEQRGTLRLRIS